MSRSVCGVNANCGKPASESLGGVVAGLAVVRSVLSTQVASAILVLSSSSKRSHRAAAEADALLRAKTVAKTVRAAITLDWLARERYMLVPFVFLFANGRKAISAALKAIQGAEAYIEVFRFLGGGLGGHRNRSQRVQVNSAWRWNSRRNVVANGPGRPSPTGFPSMRTTGCTIWLAAVMKASRAAFASTMVNGRSVKDSPLAATASSTTAREIPLRILLSARRVTTSSSAVTIQAFDDAPSVTKPWASMNQASRAPASRAVCFANTFGSSDIDLMSGRAQRLSARVMIAMPSAAMFSAFVLSWERAVTTIDGAVPGAGKA